MDARADPCSGRSAIDFPDTPTGIASHIDPYRPPRQQPTTIVLAVYKRVKGNACRLSCPQLWRQGTAVALQGEQSPPAACLPPCLATRFVYRFLWCGMSAVVLHVPLRYRSIVLLCYCPNTKSYPDSGSCPRYSTDWSPI